MKSIRTFSLLVVSCILISTIALQGCVRVRVGGPQSATNLVSEATLAQDVDAEFKPVNPSNTFYVNAETIYLSLKLNNAPANTQVMAKMTYLGGEASELANTTMYNSSQTGQGTRYLSFAIKPPAGGFPQGDYQITIFANGKEQATLPFKVQNLAAPKGWPIISKFTATPDTISPGQSTTLSWEVTNASRITLQPVIGTVTEPVGTRSVKPETTTTYTLTASSEAGAATRELTVRVGTAATGASDLVITDLWMEGLMMYYKIKNQGTSDAAPSYTYLYVDNLYPPTGGSSFADVLKPGQEKTLTFSSFQWPYAPPPSNIPAYIPNTLSPTVCFIDPATQSHIIKICADAKSEVNESNETNNCLTRIWGLLFNYDLPQVAHQATWKNGSGEVPMFGVESSKSGAYIKMGDGGLELVPEQVPNGWIQGYFGFFYTDKDSGKTQSCAIRVPPKTKFVAKIGLAENAQGSDGVTFKFGIRDTSDTLNLLPGKTMTQPGKYEDWEIDLSEYEGQKVYFVLRVDAGSNPDKDYAIWKEARVMQQD